MASESMRREIDAAKSALVALLTSRTIDPWHVSDLIAEYEVLPLDDGHLALLLEGRSDAAVPGLEDAPGMITESRGA